MKAHNLFFLFLIPFLLISACRKDAEEFSNLTTIPDPVVVIIKGNVLGKIVDENNQVIPNVQITTAQGETTTTDTAGIFFLKDIRLNQKGAYLKAEKEGYFLGSRRFYPQAGSTNYVNIQLIEKMVAGSFQSSQGGQINIQANDVQVDFPANAIINNSGQAYDGVVNVLVHWLDPSAEDLYDKMPGDLTGLSLNGEYKALESYGMLAIELEDNNGEKLNLGNGQQAELRFPLPADFASRAPETIPLWHFDEGRGIWVEEGEAVLGGNHYVGKVSHFSFWNCDDPYTLIKLSGTFIFDATEENPLENLSVKVIIKDNGEIGTGQTDHNGFFCGNVPKDEVMILQLLNECGEGIYSQVIGPFDQDTDLGNIFITPQAGSPSNQFLKIKGSFVDCNDNPITEGMVVVRYRNHSQAIYLNGSNQFETIINVCGAISEVEIRAVSFNNGFSSITETYPLSTSDTLLNVGVLLICQTEPDEYFYVETDSIRGLLPIQNQWIEGVDTMRLVGGGAIVHKYDLNNDSLAGLFHVVIPGTFAGVRNGVKESINPFSYSSGASGTLRLHQGECISGCVIDEFVITEYGAIGQPIRGYVNVTNFRIGSLIAGGASYSHDTPMQIKFKTIRTF